MSTLRNNGQTFDQRYIRYDELGLSPLGDGALWGKGTNSPNPVLGLGDTVDRPTMTQVGVATTWLQTGAGANHAGAVRTDGALWTWGTQGAGGLGLGVVTTASTPTQVGTQVDWAVVRMCPESSAALKRDGSLWAWGGNSAGQLGQNNTTPSSVPLLASPDAFVDLSIYDHLLAVKADGTLWATGANTYGRLGLGDTADRLVLTQVGLGTTWKQVSAGFDYSVGILRNGTLWAWGRNTGGQLGQGTTNEGSTTPIQVGAATDWKEVRAVGMTTYALKTNGTLWAWGLHIGTAPAQLGVATNWSTLGTAGTMSGWFSATRTDGTLWMTTGSVAGATFTQVETSTNWVTTACASSSLLAIQAP
jgi:alpha-tubulin suppressor-like RCC1 family protein